MTSANTSVKSLTKICFVLFLLLLRLIIIYFWLQYLQVKKKIVLVGGEVGLQYFTAEDIANSKGNLEFEWPFKVVPNLEKEARLFNTNVDQYSCPRKKTFPCEITFDHKQSPKDSLNVNF